MCVSIHIFRVCTTAVKSSTMVASFGAGLRAGSSSSWGAVAAICGGRLRLALKRIPRGVAQGDRSLEGVLMPRARVYGQTRRR